MPDLNLAEQIIGTASEMRANQRCYFRTRDAEALRHSRELERRLDQLIDQWKTEKKGERQTSLFQDGKDERIAKARAALLHVWPKGKDCEHAAAREAFEALGDG